MYMSDTFGSLENLAFTTKLNTTYNHVYYEQCTLKIALFAKLKCFSMALHLNSPNVLFAKYTMYVVYDRVKHCVA